MIYKKIDLELSRYNIQVLESFFETGLLFGSIEKNIITNDYTINIVFYDAFDSKKNKRQIHAHILFVTNDLEETIRYEAYIESLFQLKYLCFKIDENLTYVINTIEISLSENLIENVTIMNLHDNTKCNFISKKIIKIYNKIKNKIGKKQELEQIYEFNYIELLVYVINFLDGYDLNLFNRFICEHSVYYRDKQYLTDSIIQLILDKLNYYGYEEININYMNLYCFKNIVKEEDKFKVIASLTITCLNSLLETKQPLYCKKTQNV